MGAVGEEVRRLLTFEERHRRLMARLTLTVAATIVVGICGAVAIYFLERHAKGTEMKSFGDALFFTTVQLLTVSSQLKNPVTASGRVVDVVLEIWVHRRRRLCRCARRLLPKRRLAPNARRRR